MPSREVTYRNQAIALIEKLVRVNEGNGDIMSTILGNDRTESLGVETSQVPN
jgi:hypothetical protein